MFQPPTYDSPQQLRKLFIGGLGFSITNDQIYHHFSQFGAVIDAIVMRDSHTKCSRGFGFVTFASIVGAESAMAHKPHVLGERQVDVKRSIPRGQMPPTPSSSSVFPAHLLNFYVKPGCKLVLTGIKSTIHTIESLRTYFDVFGTLELVEVSRDRESGFVVYEKVEDAKKCLEQNGGCHVLNGEMIRVEVFKKK